MGIREIITIPDSVLRQVSNLVERVDDELQPLLDDMLETMYDAPGIGLAAIQIGIPLRIVTVDVATRKKSKTSDTNEVEDQEEAPIKPEPLFLINPKILIRSDALSTYDEGCLSIPEYYAEVERPASCKISYIDRKGKAQEIDADGILATCLQHEIDHLDGTLFIDHISKLKRDMVVKKFTKIAKQAGKL